jgi:hypothetical protein
MIEDAVVELIVIDFPINFGWEEVDKSNLGKASSSESCYFT